MTGLSAERIIAAAVNDMKAGRAEPYCGDYHGRADEVSYAAGYAEPGYSDPARGVLFANWNGFPSRLGDILESAGFACEWSDEWITCDDCGRAFRTSADSYGWQMHGVIEDCDALCHDCVDWAEVCESKEDNPRAAIPAHVNPAEFGYVRVSEPGEFENGFHPGQTDDPVTILKRLHAEGRQGVLFRVADVGQFDVRFETWIRESE